MVKLKMKTYIFEEDEETTDYEESVHVQTCIYYKDIWTKYQCSSKYQEN